MVHRYSLMVGGAVCMKGFVSLCLCVFIICCLNFSLSEVKLALHLWKPSTHAQYVNANLSSIFQTVKLLFLIALYALAGYCFLSTSNENCVVCLLT
jgi:hypothetical protein